MRNFKINTKGLIAICGVGLISALTLTIVTTFSLYFSQKDVDSNIGGNVGLRSYFHTGIGTQQDPFVITRPVHLYNLSRLQNLGIFGQEKYFELGYDLDGNPDTKEFFTGNTGTVISKYLDMSSQGAILSVGSEGMPFFGHFDGNGLTVEGLDIVSDPEDVGVFGYTATNSTISDVIFSNLSITDNGYTDPMSDIFNFTSASYPSLVINGTTINSTGTLFSDTGLIMHATFPNSLSDTKYVLRAANQYLTSNYNSETGEFTAQLNLDGTNGIYSYSDFMTTDNASISTKLSFVATRLINNITYSHVLGSYTITIYNDIVASNSILSFKVQQDYVDHNFEDTYTQYAHGNNIGFLIGHSDGSCVNCFVYNGTLNVNKNTTGRTAMAAESEIGLIGEVGVSIKNSFSPSSNRAAAGDTGVVDFSGMYQDIMGSQTQTQVSGDYTSNNGKFTQTYIYTYDGNNDEMYGEFLRLDLGKTINIAATTNTIDFKGQKVIQDTDEVNRGLGIFSLTTSNWDNETNSNNYLNGITEYTIAKDSSNTAEFYYSTAEYQRGSDVNLSSNTQVQGWNQDSTSYATRVDLGVNIPSYYDANTWTPEYERHWSYYYRCPLISDEQMASNVNYPAGYNYFANTDSDWLATYFNYKLIDKDGNNINKGAAECGVMVKHVDISTQESSNITAFNSYCTLTNDGAGVVSTMTIDNAAHPTKSIEFTIDNAEGANVTVFAAAKSNSYRYVGVYNVDYTLSPTNNVSGKYVSQYPDYAMYLPPSTTSNGDKFGYFNYDPLIGTTATSMTFANSNNKLFAHTFKLPKGSYFIGNPRSSYPVYIYYVCAQGQNAGNTNGYQEFFENKDVITNVDFLLYDPKEEGFTLSTSLAYLTFETTMSVASSTIDVEALSGEIHITQPSQSHILIWNPKENVVYLNGVSYTLEYIEGTVS